MRALRLGISAGLLTLIGACTCDDPRDVGTPVPHAEAVISLHSASEDVRAALYEALAAEGSFGASEGYATLPCVERWLWPLEGDDTWALWVDTEHDGGCEGPPMSRHAELHRAFRRRPDSRPHPGRGFRAPRLAFQQRWTNHTWAQRYVTFGRMDLKADDPLTPQWADDHLPPNIAVTGPAHRVQIRSWKYPAWVFGKSTYRVRLEQERCVDGGTGAAQLILSRHGAVDAYIPHPGRQAMERVIERLSEHVAPVRHPDTAARCAPHPEASP